MSDTQAGVEYDDSSETFSSDLGSVNYPLSNYEDNSYESGKPEREVIRARIIREDE